jgi:hypothetical protein
VTVVSFADYTPVPRFDNVPWTTVLIEESDAEFGVYNLIDTQLLSPIDPDPSDPMVRQFTTDQATLDHGWYKISFADASNNVIEMVPTFNGVPIEWVPTLPDVAGVNLIRTRDNNGVFQNTFNDDTIPNADQARQCIDKAVNNVRPLIGSDIPEDLIQEAQDVVSLRTMMYIELSFFGNEVAQNRSIYPQLKVLFDEKIKSLQSAIISEEAGEDALDQLAGAGGRPDYAYPPTDWIYSRPL